MAIHEKKPPLLTGFSRKGASRGEPLTNPATTLWLGIMFMAILFAIYGAKRNWDKAEESLETPLRYSPYLSDAPEKNAEIQPPPDPSSLFGDPEETLVLTKEDIRIEQPLAPIELKPIDIELTVEVPSDLRPRQDLSN